ncbi:hypothetical protein [Streptomyces olivochromogenes]|uniref:hypothetical protein n=1 Tax=Streptomyces olivochromogenes TaxID=1963 RepID=UPI001F16FEBB|nr:hypothetical protein [Streptomyces olivochromogenes]MCF3129115.1 hypothetical protein [Streptomyces olivochromogenes]
MYVEPGVGVRVRREDRWQVYCSADAPDPDGRYPVTRSAAPRAADEPVGGAPRFGTNRFAGACMDCSVEVAAGAGVLVTWDDGRRRVQCPVCQEVAFRHERWDENDQFGVGSWFPSESPAGCGATISVRILTLNRPCWKCGEVSTCVVGLRPFRPALTDPGPRSVDGISLVWVRELLEQAGVDWLASSIKPRWSATMRQRYLSNGCQHCDALQGDFPLEGEVSELVRESGVEALDTVLVADVPALVWQRTVHGERGEGSGLLA